MPEESKRVQQAEEVRWSNSRMELCALASPEDCRKLKHKALRSKQEEKVSKPKFK